MWANVHFFPTMSARERILESQYVKSLLKTNICKCDFEKIQQNSDFLKTKKKKPEPNSNRGEQKTSNHRILFNNNQHILRNINQITPTMLLSSRHRLIAYSKECVLKKFSAPKKIEFINLRFDFFFLFSSIWTTSFIYPQSDACLGFFFSPFSFFYTD